ncbi:hypothetical protein MTO96_029671 [Rhipicephalus appendiculatus]
MTSTMVTDRCWSIAIVSACCAFITLFTYSSSGLMYVLFMEEFHISHEQAAWPQSTYIVVANSIEDTAVASVYIRPCRPWDPSCLRQLAHRLGKNCLLCGDVNAHHPAWGGRKTDPRGREVRDMPQQLGLVILNTGAVTYFRRGAQATSTAIDLSMATEGCRYAWSPFPDTWGSDHRPILLSPFRGKAPRDREYRVVDWRVYRQLFKQDTGGTDLLQLVPDNARAATVVAKVPQGKPAPDIQHLAFRAAWRRAGRQALSKAQPELWTVFRRVDAVCRRHANRRRNQGWVSVCVSIDRSRDGTRAWRLLKCLLMVPRAFNQVLSLAVHLTIQAADLAEQLADQFAVKDIAQLPAAPPPAALQCLASCHHPGWIAVRLRENHSHHSTPLIVKAPNFLAHCGTLLRSGTLYILLVCYVMIDFVVQMHATTIVEYGADKKVGTLKQRNQLQIFNAVGQLAGGLVVPWLSDKMPLSRCAFTSANLIVVAACLLLTAVVQDYVTLSLLTAAIGVCEGYLFCIKGVLVGEKLGVESLGLFTRP